MLSTKKWCRYLALGILLTVLGSCFVILPLGIAGISVPASVLSGVANLLLLGITTIPLTRCLFQHTRHDARLPILVNSIGLVLSAVIFVPYIVLSNMASIYRFRAGLDKNSRSLVASLSVDLSVAFYTTYFVAALVGSAIIAYALIRAGPNLSLRPKVCVFLHQASQPLMEIGAQILAWLHDRGLAHRFGVSSYRNVRVVSTCKTAFGGGLGSISGHFQHFLHFGDVCDPQRSAIYGRPRSGSQGERNV
jgi:hypothetical protein